MTDTLISFGSEIKVLEETDDALRVGGWAVVFDSHDASRLRDKFLKSTDFDIEDGETRSLYYNHGLDGTIKKTRLGRATLAVKDAGVWYEGEIKKRNDYLKQHAAKIIEGVKAGLFGTSTGAPAHLVERKAIDGGHEVTLWPISEISITPTPAEPMTSCISLKSLIEAEEYSGADDALKYNPDQPRDDEGKFASGSSSSGAAHGIPRTPQEAAHIKELLSKAVEHGRIENTREDKLAVMTAAQSLLESGKLNDWIDATRAALNSVGKTPPAVTSPFSDAAPHHMTQEAFLERELQAAKDRTGGKSRNTTMAKRMLIGHHRDHIERALQDEAPVPHAVIARYPDLRRKYSPNPNERLQAQFSALHGYGAGKSLDMNEFEDVLGDGTTEEYSEGADNAMKAEPPFKFASTQVNLNADDAAAIMEWAKENIPDDVLSEDGRENQPHITILYGLHDDDRTSVQSVAAGFGPIRARVLPIDCFEADEYDVVICPVDSPDLHRLRGKLEILPHTSTYPEYKPHITLAYVKKGTGKLFNGKHPFNEGPNYRLEDLTFDTFYLSNKQGDLQPVSTNERAARKSIEEYSDETDNQFQSLYDLETGLHDGLSLKSHSTAVLAAMDELAARYTDLAVKRCEADNRRWSAAKFDELTMTSQAIKGIAEELDALAQAHAPRNVADAVSREAMDAELIEAELNLARLNLQAVSALTPPAR